MSNFPKLIPAFTANIVIDAPVTVGAVSKGAPLFVVPFLTENTNNFLKSEPEYPIQVDAVFVHGNDFIRQDPSGQHVRLDVNSVMKDKSGAFISYKYSGIINVTPGVGAVLTGDASAKTTPFGDAFTHVLFETGSEALKDIEKKIYVASGRFVLQEGKPVTVEYNISEVAV
ncbi:hypothetical protein ONS95_004810 [Cadophora gregata]|uniref:uncharacterized protein n=1 Tax=Cadophora gregata TaxID=51156 RepID=UPI0026DD813B|nr:uncharacterized protein ONS95_004810 [Cadophora gregata]KAK0104521.1 hypothetical protein ONS95_004810 [Cadophora gregata]KAK0115385.1 hypothetical protein ONS96_013842 [Cadophora gregata f. sp. sojae]